MNEAQSDTAPSKSSVGVTTLTALAYLLVTVYWPKGHMVLAVTDVVLFGLAVTLIAMGLRAIGRRRVVTP